MAVADRRGAAAALALSALLTLSLAGCGSGGDKAEPLPPRAVAAVQPEPPPPSDPLVAHPVPPPTVVIVDPGPDPSAAPETLAEASRRARAERQQAPPPVVEINDRNLADFVEGVQLTVAQPAMEAAPPAPAPEAGGLGEAEWRQRGLDIRKRWREAVDSITRLESEAAALRNRFYAADDPYVRDAQIKPQWDRVLAELAEARRRSEAGPGEVERFLEEGRRAGALPGWLREGAELEPTPVVLKTEPGESLEPLELPNPTGP